MIRHFDIMEEKDEKKYNLFVDLFEFAWKPEKGDLDEFKNKED